MHLTALMHGFLAPRHVAALACICAGALAPQAAQATPTMVYGDLTVTAFAQTKLVYDVKSEPPPTPLPTGDPTKVSAFAGHPVTEPGWYFGGFALGTPTRHPGQAFASAQMDGSAFSDLGVSGSSEGPTVQSWSFQKASEFATQRVTNTANAGPVLLSYTIPLIEIAHFGTRFEGEVAAVEASLTIDRYDSNGNHIKTINVFDYRLGFTYEKPPTDYALLSYPVSDDLLRDSAGLVDVTHCGGFRLTCGKAVGPFSVLRDFIIDSGDYLEYTYFVDSYLITGREGGGHALYGDPFAITGGDGRNLLQLTGVDVAPTTMSEPSSWALLGMGFAALALRRRKNPTTAVG